MAIDHRPSTIDRIFLVGFMGAGKTTVGRLLAQRLRWGFVDLDDRIRERERREIAEIFAQSGESYFRQVEGECLRELIGSTTPQGLLRSAQDRLSAGAKTRRALGMTSQKGLVIALGGGAYAQAENVAMLRATRAPVVFLDAGVEELRRRCSRAGAERPLFRDENQFRQLYEARRGGYMTADLRVDTEGKTPEQVVNELLAFSS